MGWGGGGGGGGGLILLLFTSRWVYVTRGFIVGGGGPHKQQFTVRV